MLFSLNSGTLIIWDVEKQTQLGKIDSGHELGIRHFAFSPNNKIIATSGLTSGAQRDPIDNKIMLWNPENQTILGELKHVGAVENLIFSPNGKILVAASSLTGRSSEIGLVLWDVERQTMLAKIDDKFAYPFAFTISPDNKTLAFTGKNKNIIFWDITAQTILDETHDNYGFIGSLAFSPYDDTLVFGNERRGLTYLDVSKPNQASQYESSSHRIFSYFDFSANGRTLAALSGNKIFILDSVKKILLGEFTMERNYGYPFLISPNGKILAAKDPNGFDVTIFDVEKFANLHKFNNQTGRINSIAFSPDSETLALSTGGEIILHKIVNPVHACEIANRNMTCEEWQEFMGNKPYRQICGNLPAPESTCH